MFIQTEETPNPATLKFIPGEVVMPQGTCDFPNTEKAHTSPLAGELFAIEGVTGVFYGSDFITVTKAPDQDWQVLKPSILGAIMDHYTSERPLFNEGTPEASASSASEDDDELVSQIKELLDTRIRPAVAQDGGDIVFQAFEEGVVYLRMQGACAGCPSSTATLKAGIENMLRHYVPEVEEVQAVA